MVEMDWLEVADLVVEETLLEVAYLLLEVAYLVVEVDSLEAMGLMVEMAVDVVKVLVSALVSAWAI
jgi:hypothetical protein